MKYLPRVLHYLRPYRKLAVFSVLIIIASTLAALLAPWPLKILIDSVLGHKPAPAILAPVLRAFGDDRTTLMLCTVVGGFIIVLVINGLSVLNNYVNTKLHQYMILDFRSDLFQHAQRLSLAFHDRRRSGMLIYAINSQADAPASLALAIPPLAESALTLIGMFIISYRIDSQLALLSLVIVPFLYYSVGYYTKHIQARLLEVKGMEGESLAIIHEGISMLRVIVAFGREDYEHKRFRNFSEKAVDARVKLTVRETLFTLAVNVITAIGTALVLGVSAYHAIQGHLTIGQLLVIMAYIGSVYKPLEAISYTVGSLQDRLITMQMAFKLLDAELDIKDAPGAIHIQRTQGRIVFDHVDFSYEGRTDTLQDVCFTTEPGQVVAVVGPTGAGKTTLVSLLPRFYEQTKGRILLDGQDIRQITLQSLRQQISLVLQEPLLFSGSIADNIRYGRLEATSEQIIEAAKAANAHDFIMRLPEQYETQLGERGAAISGGERQRISVARAFLKDAPILILDEPTSSIDSKTEAIILDALDRLMVGRTTFMIAHRLSTVRNADLILVMNQGRIVEQGSQEELLRQPGLYKQLFDSQAPQARRSARPNLIIPTAS